MPDLLIRPRPAASGVQLALTPALAREATGSAWEHIGLTAVTLEAGATWQGENAGVECAIVVLAGRCEVTSDRGDFAGVGERRTVFEGRPHALYLPLGCRFEVKATTRVEFAVCTSVATKAHPPVHIRPEDVPVEIRGAGNATRQIHGILPPDFPADRLLVVEVFTPSGNWSSYPPHKHDAHAMPGEADLEEIYYYRIDKPEGYAIQKVYTDDRRLDEILTVRDGELVLIPEGYHPVVAPPGYNVYYLNVLAGSARSMAASDDPDYAWVRRSWALAPQDQWLFGQPATTPS